METFNDKDTCMSVHACVSITQKYYYISVDGVWKHTIVVVCVCVYVCMSVFPHCFYVMRGMKIKC